MDRLLPYIMIPFAIFGDFRYIGMTWAIPIPLVYVPPFSFFSSKKISGFVNVGIINRLGYATTRWLYRRLDATYHTGEYAKLPTDEEDVLDNDGLPAYGEHISHSVVVPVVTVHSEGGRDQL